MSARWACSAFGYAAHLLLADEHQSPGGLIARCGHQLAGVAFVNETPPAGRKCPRCDVLLLADECVERFGRPN